MSFSTRYVDTWQRSLVWRQFGDAKVRRSNKLAWQKPNLSFWHIKSLQNVSSQTTTAIFRRHLVRCFKKRSTVSAMVTVRITKATRSFKTADVSETNVHGVIWTFLLTIYLPLLTNVQVTSTWELIHFMLGCHLETVHRIILKNELDLCSIYIASLNA